MSMAVTMRVLAEGEPLRRRARTHAPAPAPARARMGLGGGVGRRGLQRRHQHLRGRATRWSSSHAEPNVRRSHASSAPTTHVDSADAAPGSALRGLDLTFSTFSTFSTIPTIPTIARFAQLFRGLRVHGRIEDAMRFAVPDDVRPMIERLPLEAAGEALDRLAAGKPRFRVVVDTTPDR